MCRAWDVRRDLQRPSRQVCLWWLVGGRGGFMALRAVNIGVIVLLVLLFLGINGRLVCRFGMK